MFLQSRVVPGNVVFVAIVAIIAPAVSFNLIVLVYRLIFGLRSVALLLLL